MCQLKKIIFFRPKATKLRKLRGFFTKNLPKSRIFGRLWHYCAVEKTAK